MANIRKKRFLLCEFVSLNENKNQSHRYSRAQKTEIFLENIINLCISENFLCPTMTVFTTYYFT